MTIVAKKLRESAGHPDAYCTLQIAGVCPDNTDSKTAGCMLCHIRLPGEVGGQRRGARVREHPIHLRRQHRRVAEPAR